MRKLDFCLCENKDTDQLSSKCTAEQRLCFHYMDSASVLLYMYSVTAQTDLCRTWSETRIVFSVKVNYRCNVEVYSGHQDR